MDMYRFPRPIYVGTRTFLGLKDLVVSLYTEKCQFQCAYCNLPEKSHPGPLTIDQIKQQIDWILEEHEDNLDHFQQFSIGNEGSILDPRKFPKTALDYVLVNTRRFKNLHILSLETRPEYVKPELMEEIGGVTQVPVIDITIGFETQDDHLREIVLKKTIRRKLLEEKIQLLGQLGIRLTSYVLLKPGPQMTEEEGIVEAINTIDYLADVCQRFNTSLVIYLNPVYAAKGTPLAEQFLLHNYRPPHIQSVVQIIAATRQLAVPIYTGLWSESNAEDNGDYRSLKNHQQKVCNAVKQYNKTQDYGLIAPFVMESAKVSGQGER